MPFLRTAAVAATVLLSAAVAGSPVLAQTAPASSAAPAAADETDPLKMVVATVGDGSITLADLVAMRESLPAQYRQMPLQALYPHLLERAIDGYLIAQAARATDLRERADVKLRIRRAEDEVLSQVYLSESIAEKVTEEALRQRYETTATGDGGKVEAHARHILVDTEEQAKDVIAELGKGGDFANLAKERSTDPGAAEGGDLGWFTADQMVPEFSTAAFALEPGSYTKEPVKSQFGWHVILLEEKRTAAPPAFEEMKSQLAAEMTRELINARLAELRKDVSVQRFGPDGSPMPAPQ